MSRIGNRPILLPEKIELKIDQNSLSVTGSQGSLSMNFDTNFVSFSQEENLLIVKRKNETKDAKSRHGLYRSLAQNLITGVTEGFKKTLEIKGVGYRVNLKNDSLELFLGFSHPIIYKIPSDVKIVFPDQKNQNILEISGLDKQKVGQVAAKIREFRKPEPYKGKGIRYTDEVIVKKAGKAAKKEK